ncbi:glycosyltransferase family 4 protein [Gonapodya prolifera JEL478]|uniref:Glycosyltransferase family 4 protein n=1 Tax=Gonapodya prolifera (strain JEL478) TaxID=1344416 RepID=A0A139A548_GONPJ|nr:glycosyltransferase family 4 protein [Gonapodya prolifera JEL478]|eukprot:KXS11864.1 glycosyltransferase family 4 protein [Gonapodya prolifera JEL478]
MVIIGILLAIMFCISFWTGRVVTTTTTTTTKPSTPNVGSGSSPSSSSQSNSGSNSPSTSSSSKMSTSSVIYKIHLSGKAKGEVLVDKDVYEQFSGKPIWLAGTYVACTIDGKTTKLHDVVMGLFSNTLSQKKITKEGEMLMRTILQRKKGPQVISEEFGNAILVVENSKSGYIGVSKKGSRWRAIIGSIHIGMAETKEEAAFIYNVCAKLIYGESAKMNEVPVIDISEKLENINKVVQKFLIEKNETKKQSLTIQRNSDGVAIIKTSNTQEDILVDNEDYDTLYATRAASYSENIHRSRMDNNKTFRGVREVGKESFGYYIKKNGRNFTYGGFPSARNAAIARDKHANQLYGDKALLNFENEILIDLLYVRKRNKFEFGGIRVSRKAYGASIWYNGGHLWIEHSYAIEPLYGQNWRDSDLLKDDHIVKYSKENAWRGETLNSVFRVSFPFDISHPLPGVTAYIFCTFEFQKVYPEMFVNGTIETFKRLCEAGKIVPVPSQWCGNALDVIGVTNYIIVPHGVDPNIFHPCIADKSRLCHIFGPEFYDASKDPFIFLSVGSMFNNKAINHIVTAFEKLHKNKPNIRLMLKGFSSLYGIPPPLQQQLDALDKNVRSAIAFTAETDRDLAYLYNCSDVYVAPYYAEGFSMPVLEAFACGIPVIVTENGVSDEYLPKNGKGKSWLPIKSQMCKNEQGDIFVVPSEEDLFEKMKEIALNPNKYTRRAIIEGIETYTKRGYDWDSLANKLYEEMKKKNEYSIIIGVKEPQLAYPVAESLGEQCYVLNEGNYPSFSKLVNDIVMLSPTDIVIFCSHKIRPTCEDIQNILKRLNSGYALVTGYQYAFFGLHKALFKKIGMFDERFKIGGYEDNDLIIRLHEANLAYYESEEVAYVAVYSSAWKSKTSRFGKNGKIHLINFSTWQRDYKVVDIKSLTKVEK